jgi:hypothetical protein
MFISAALLMISFNDPPPSNENSWAPAPQARNIAARKRLAMLAFFMRSPFDSLCGAVRAHFQPKVYLIRKVRRWAKRAILGNIMAYAAMSRKSYMEKKAGSI